MNAEAVIPAQAGIQNALGPRLRGDDGAVNGQRSCQQALRAFALDSGTLAGPLEGRLQAMRDAGFRQLTLQAADLVAHPGGWRAAVAAVRASGLRVAAFQLLRDFEGLSGHLHCYKVDVARTLLEMCAALGCELLVASASVSSHASADLRHVARDLRKLAMLGIPLGIRIAYRAPPGGRAVQDLATAWDVVCRADAPNLGLALDAFRFLAAATPLDAIDDLDPEKLLLVQLSDSIGQEDFAALRVFPGEGLHTDALVQLALRLDALGYAGPYSLEVLAEDLLQLPPEAVVRRAGRAAAWLGEAVLRRCVPLPGPLKRHVACVAGADLAGWRDSGR